MVTFCLVEFIIDIFELLMLNVLWTIWVKKYLNSYYEQC